MEEKNAFNFLTFRDFYLLSYALYHSPHRLNVHCRSSTESDDKEKHCHSTEIDSNFFRSSSDGLTERFRQTGLNDFDISHPAGCLLNNGRCLFISDGGFLLKSSFLNYLVAGELVMRMRMMVMVGGIETTGKRRTQWVNK